MKQIQHCRSAIGTQTMACSDASGESKCIIFQGSDLLFAADCVAFSMGDFHNNHLKGKSLAIACPKLDQGTDSYVEKLTAMIDIAKVNTITVMMMEVPCCGGFVADG